MEEKSLKKDSLNIWETVALLVAIMGPSASVAVTTGMMVSYAGYAAPAVFLLAMIIIGFVAVSILKLNELFPSSGSVYYFAEMTLGKRAGFVTGWMILLAYLLLGTGCAAVSTSYFQSLLMVFGISIPWKLIGILLVVVIWYLSQKDVKSSTNVMLALEVVSMGLIFILSVVILFVASRSTGLSLKPFHLEGHDFGGIAYASVFGILAFSGFEGASALGEESKNPRKTIPIAITSAILLSGLFYIFVSYAQILGFGISTEGLKAFAGNEAPLKDLIQRYLGEELSLIILFCVAVSFFSATLGCISAGARVLFSMSRDKMLPESLKRTNGKGDVPFVGINLYCAVVLVILLLNYHLKAMEVGGYAVMTGTLSLVLSYIITILGAIFFFSRKKIWKWWQLFIPCLSVLTLSIIFLANIFPAPAFPMNILGYGVIGWFVMGVGLSIKLTLEHKPSVLKKEA